MITLHPSVTATTEAYRLCALLKNRRQELGWTQQKLSRESGVHYNTIPRYEQQQRLPRLDLFIQLATAMNLKVTLRIYPKDL
jgi:transcriptional regulator with XRE-family HTH domain